MKRTLALVLAVMLIALGTPLPLHAAGGAIPQGKGSISGIAKDHSGQPCASCTVQLRDVASGQVISTGATSSTGAFSFVGLNPGNYVVEIVGASGKVIGVSSSLSLTAANMTISGVALTSTGAGVLGAAGTGGGVGAFFGSTAGIVVLAAAGAGIVGGVVAASGNGSPSK